MLKILDRCQKCSNACKQQTETNAKLISCKQYLSKRSTAPQFEKGKGNVFPVNYRSL